VNSLFAFLSLVAPVAIMIALVILAQLSQRLGAVTKRPPLYRWLYLCVVLVGLSVIVRLLNLNAPETLGDDYSALMLYDVLMALGLGLAVIITWRYWNWLLSEPSRNIRKS
jgi:hypothetical protein